MGIILAFELSQYLGHCDLQEVIRVKNHFVSVGLPTKLSDISDKLWKPENLIAHMQRDKKAHSGKIIFVLVNKIGKSFISQNVKLNDVEAVLSTNFNEYE